jgi:glycosyltransferase involved in cell wall biosynthesis
MIPDAASRVTVMSNPIPVHPDRSPRFDPAALRRELGVPDGAFVVGFASRLVERKGWRDFLEALTRIDPSIPLYFLVAGDGDDRELAVAHVREHGLAARGRLLGRIAWMGRFYQALDCFVMPSHWEPHGLAHLEAQAFGVPVIVSDVPGLGGTVHAERDALLCAPGDSAALAHCIERVARDPSLRARLVAAGLENASRFTMEAFAARLDEIYASRRETIGEKS